MNKSKQVNVSLGTRCTLLCSKCRRTEFKEQGISIDGGDLSMEDFKKLADEIYTNLIKLPGSETFEIVIPDIKAYISCAFKDKKECTSKARSKPFYKSQKEIIKIIESFK